jgi:RPA family protein
MTDIIPSFKRESAKHMFAGEFRGVKFTEKFSTDDKAPTFIISPTGELAARLIVVGVITDKERTVTKDKTNTMYRARVNDGTGDFFISASSFQPEAMMQLARIDVPAIVSVVGKPKVFTKEDGSVFTSINAESVTVVDKETRDIWKLKTAADTLRRISDIELGESQFIKNVKEKYNTNVETYKSIVNKALTRSA